MLIPNRIQAMIIELIFVLKPLIYSKFMTLVYSHIIKQVIPVPINEINNRTIPYNNSFHTFIITISDFSGYFVILIYTYIVP